MKIRHKRLIVYSLFVGVLFSIMISATYPVTDDYLLNNSEWNGCSQLRDMARTGIERDLQRVKVLEPANTLAIVVGPTKPFSRGEADLLREFLENEGTMLLVDNTGRGNLLLEQLGVPARFDEGYLLDPLFYNKQSRFPLIYSFAPDPLTGGVNTCLLGNPRGLTIRDKNIVRSLAYTSPFSFLDSNGNGVKDLNEKQGPFVVAATLKMGLGRLILLSSPDMLTNSLLEKMDNKQLVLNILYDSGKMAKPFVLLFDESHLERSQGIGVLVRENLNKVFSTVATPEIQIETKITLALIAASTILLVTILRDEPEEATHLGVLWEDVEELIRKHPDWKRETLEYLRRHIGRRAGGPDGHG